jgi:drug/metabolite transporter (DMT)-like permease
VSMAGPVFGLLFGWWLFDTIPEATSVAGTALVCVALTLIAVNRPPAS